MKLKTTVLPEFLTKADLVKVRALIYNKDAEFICSAIMSISGWSTWGPRDAVCSVMRDEGINTRGNGFSPKNLPRNLVEPDAPSAVPVSENTAYSWHHRVRFLDALLELPEAGEVSEH